MVWKKSQDQILAAFNIRNLKQPHYCYHNHTSDQTCRATSHQKEWKPCVSACPEISVIPLQSILGCRCCNLYSSIKKDSLSSSSHRQRWILTLGEWGPAGVSFSSLSQSFFRAGLGHCLRNKNSSVWALVSDFHLYVQPSGTKRD